MTYIRRPLAARPSATESHWRFGRSVRRLPVAFIVATAGQQRQRGSKGVRRARRMEASTTVTRTGDT